MVGYTGVTFGKKKNTIKLGSPVSSGESSIFSNASNFFNEVEALNNPITKSVGDIDVGKYVKEAEPIIERYGINIDNHRYKDHWAYGVKSDKVDVSYLNSQLINYLNTLPDHLKAKITATSGRELTEKSHVPGSKHYQGDAVDLRYYDDLYNYMKNDPLLEEYGLGLLNPNHGTAKHIDLRVLKNLHKEAQYDRYITEMGHAQEREENNDDDKIDDEHDKSQEVLEKRKREEELAVQIGELEKKIAREEAERQNEKQLILSLISKSGVQFIERNKDRNTIDPFGKIDVGYKI